MKDTFGLRPFKFVFCGDVLLAILAGVTVFVLLNLVSGEVLVSVFTVSAALAIFGLLHYFAWGRALGRRVVPPQGQWSGGAPPSGGVVGIDEIAVNLGEPERQELVRLLEQALARTSRGPVEEQESPRAALDRQLVDKLRMFGA